MRSCATAGALFGVVCLALIGLAGSGCEEEHERSESDRATPVQLPSVSAAVESPANSAARESDSSMSVRLEELTRSWERCGELPCARYEGSARALEALLGTEPSVLAVGEAHALKGADSVPTATERFEREMLPVLAKHGASQLVVELLKPAPQCTQAVAEVRKEQKQVTEHQAPRNQNRFVSLGHAAKRLQVTPFLLEPECAAYQSIAQAGPDSVIRMLEVIAEETQRRVIRFWTSQQRLAAQGERPGLVVAYGGAMHNDVVVPEEKAKLAFGAELRRVTGDRYLELDLIVPEFIRDTAVWRELPWYSHFDAKVPKPHATLLRAGPRSFVLIFAHSEPAAAPRAD